MIEIIEGDFPKQTTMLITRSWLYTVDMLLVKTSEKKPLKYNARAAVGKVETIVSHKSKPTVKISLRDGKTIIARVDFKTFEQLCVLAALDVKEGTSLFVEEKKTPLKPKKHVEKVHWAKKEYSIVKPSLCILALFIGYQVFSPSDYSPNTAPAVVREAQPMSPQQIAEQEKQALAVRADKLINEVRGFETFLAEKEQFIKTTKPSQMALADIRQMLSTFNGVAEYLNNALSATDVKFSEKDKAYLKQIKTRLSVLQQKSFPGMRLAFRMRANELLWEHNVDVAVKGSGNTVLEFIGGMFSVRSNIKQVQEQIGDIVEQLRYKQTRFRWHRHSDESTYYALKTPADAQVSVFKIGAFSNVK